jgi:SPP1 gp7 family putative phage head morphogenesis protein
MSAQLPPRLTVHRFVVHRARARAETAFVAGATSAYREAWSIIVNATKHLPTHDLAKAAGDPADPRILQEIRALIVRQLNLAAANAADALIAGENTWFEVNGIAWDPLQKQELLERYQQTFARDVPSGGFSNIADTAVEPIQHIVSDYYTDPGMGLPDLTSQLKPYFSGWKARQIGITETTRMASANADLVATRVGADTWEWDSANDSHVCPICAGLDGQHFAMTDQQQAPPSAHVGCRCSKTILVES